MILRRFMVVAMVAAGCENRAAIPDCADSRSLVAVAADANAAGAQYVVDSGPQQPGYPYAVVRASTGETIWQSINDGTAVALLAPASGGVVVVNGGAAARRFDAAGALSWTVGYGAEVGVTAALTGGDWLVIADNYAVRLYAPDGTAVWQRPLPGAGSAVFQVVGDRGDGAWVFGIASSEVFLRHFGAGGEVIGDRAWSSSQDARDNQEVMAVDDGGQPMLVVRSRPGGFPPIINGFGPTAELLWSAPIDYGVVLAADADGKLLSLHGVSGSLTIDRLDAMGSSSARATVPVDMTMTDVVGFATAPVPGGIIVAGEGADAGCGRKPFLLQVTTADLAASPLTLRLP